MATAKEKIVTKVEEVHIELTLTKAEAQTLRDILGNSNSKVVETLNFYPLYDALMQVARHTDSSRFTIQERKSNLET